MDGELNLDEAFEHSVKYIDPRELSKLWSGETRSALICKGDQERFACFKVQTAPSWTCLALSGYDNVWSTGRKSRFAVREDSSDTRSIFNEDR